MATVRQVVGGLLLPSIAVVIDKLVISHIVPCSAIFITFIVTTICFSNLVSWKAEISLNYMMNSLFVNSKIK